MATLEVDRLCYQIVTRRGVTRIALRDISFSVGAGECLALVGPSGCGKTTLLRLIAGLDSPDSGRIIFGGRELTHVDPKDRGIAMVFQGLALFPHLSVRENLALGLRLRQVPRPERSERVEALVHRFQLETHADQLPEVLSGGERQRVALGRALVQKPVVLLLDEPLSDLDPPLRAELRVELRRLARELGLATVHVTHDQAEALALGDQLAVMRNGTIEQCGPPREVYCHPDNLFVARFLGTHPLNVWDGVVHCQDTERWIDVKSIGTSFSFSSLDETKPEAVLMPGQTVTLATRPEDVQVVTDGAPGVLVRRGQVEYLGHQQLGELHTSDATIRCVVSSATPWVPGEAVGMRFNMPGVFLFSRESGRRLPVRVNAREHH